MYYRKKKLEKRAFIQRRTVPQSKINTSRVFFGRTGKHVSQLCGFPSTPPPPPDDGMKRKTIKGCLIHYTFFAGTPTGSTAYGRSGVVVVAGC